MSEAIHDLPQLDVVYLAQLLDFDKLTIELAFVEIQDVGHTTRHACGNVASGWSEHHSHTTSHVLAQVISCTLDHDGGTTVTHAATLANNSAQMNPT